MIRALMGDHGETCAVCGKPATHFHDGVMRCGDPDCHEAVEKKHEEIRLKNAQL